MRKLAILFVLALVTAVSGCGGNTVTSTPTTQTSGSWEAELISGTGQSSLLNFVISFNLNQTGSLDVTGISFFNSNSCFDIGLDLETATGTATLTTTNADTVSGPFSLTIVGAGTGSKLVLNGTITGTSSGTIYTTGNLSNGSVTGQWSLTPGAGAGSSCIKIPAASGDPLPPFIMCQGAATCTPTGAAEIHAIKED